MEIRKKEETKKYHFPGKIMEKNTIGKKIRKYIKCNVSVEKTLKIKVNENQKKGKNHKNISFLEKLL